MLQLRPGIRITATSHRVGETPRRGEVVDVLGEPGHERCRVRWDDGHETLVYPGADIRVERATAERHEEVE